MEPAQKICKHCRTTIDKRASRCPNCSGDLRVWPSRHPIIFVMLILFVGLPVFAGVVSGISGGTKSSTASKAAPSINYTSYDLKGMIAEYDANQIAADAKFKGYNVKLSGYVGNISKDILGDAYITVNPVADANYYGTHVQCYMEESEATKTGNGRPVTVGGKVKGMSLGIIGVEDCKIL